MTQALAKPSSTENSGGSGVWTAQDVALIKHTVASGATESEFKLFLYTASKYGLDPLVKQVWCIKYGTRPAAIFTSRDGFLSIAHRSGQFNGMKTEPVLGDDKMLIAASCRVWRKDMSNPFEVTVYRQEYDTGQGNWQKMPITMLCKVAESQCLRRAFDISGLYEPSEMGQAGFAGPAQASQQQPQVAQGKALPFASATNPNNREIDNMVGQYVVMLEEVSTIAHLKEIGASIKREIPEGHEGRNRLKRIYETAQRQLATAKPVEVEYEGNIEKFPANSEEEEEEEEDNAMLASMTGAGD